MLSLALPNPDFSVRKEKDVAQIFDKIRKRWVRLTPEEWVRQNMIAMIMDSLQVPLQFIGIEKEIIVSGLKKRFDLLIYDRLHQPWMLIECKAEHVKLNPETAAQLLRYHQVLQVKYLIITNGQSALGWLNGQGEITEMQQWPVFDF
jgi:hypothetical protein